MFVCLSLTILAVCIKKHVLECVFLVYHHYHPIVCLCVSICQTVSVHSLECVFVCVCE